MSHLGFIAVLIACQTGEPLSPLRSLEQMKVHAGYHVELVASEPLISDPVSIAFGPPLGGFLGRGWADSHSRRP
jgi:hypothetical protein